MRCRARPAWYLLSENCDGAEPLDRRGNGDAGPVARIRQAGVPLCLQPRCITPPARRRHIYCGNLLFFKFTALQHHRLGLEAWRLSLQVKARELHKTGDLEQWLADAQAARFEFEFSFDPVHCSYFIISAAKL